MDKMISAWIYDDNNQKVGMVVAAALEDNIFNIDYSLCSANDHFDKELARTIAQNRAMQNRKYRSILPVNPFVAEAYEDMYQRSLRYFKGAKPSVKVENFIRLFNE